MPDLELLGRLHAVGMDAPRTDTALQDAVLEALLRPLVARLPVVRHGPRHHEHPRNRLDHLGDDSVHEIGIFLRELRRIVRAVLAPERAHIRLVPDLEHDVLVREMLRRLDRKGRESLARRIALHASARLLVEGIRAEERHDDRKAKLLAEFHLRFYGREVVDTLLLLHGVPVEPAPHDAEPETAHLAQRRLVERVGLHLHAHVHRHNARRKVIRRRAQRGEGHCNCCSLLHCSPDSLLHTAKRRVT